MKKIICAFVSVGICGIPVLSLGASTDDRSRCETLTRTKYMLNYEDNSRYQQIFNTLLDSWKNTVNTTSRNGNCSGTGIPYTTYKCDAGQKNQDCVPEACWGISVSVNAQQQFIDEMVAQTCGGGPTDNSAPTKTSAPAATTMTISGTITDTTGETLPGATVRGVQNPGIGTTTDMNGNFTLAKFPAGDMVQISYLGYRAQTVSPGENLKIVMQEDASQLDEVVVTASFKSRACNATELAPLNAKTGHTVQNPNGGGVLCVPDTCNEPQYKLTGSGDNATCEDQVGKACKAPKNADSAKYIMENGKLICSPTCKTNYVINDAKTGCDASDGPCPQAQVAAIENATKGELKKGKCIATECKPGFEPSDGKCVAIAGNCPDKPENAKKSHREFDAATNTEICIIDECKSGFSVSADKKSCTADPKAKLSEEDSKKQIEELSQNAQNMRAKEQSIENKTLGAASMATTGIGAMNLMSGMAEQNADDDAERAMKAYLETFRCNYGGGSNFKGGEVNIELPGGNDLAALRREYMALAADLKQRKEQLGIAPGIESEVILDQAATGLYDDVGTGITGGAYTSVARALMDKNGDDAAAWAAQKADAASKTKTGLITTAAGVGIGAIGNLALNSGASKQDQSAAILKKYEPLKSLESKISQLPDNDPKTCPTGATGTYPNCTCGTGALYNNNTGTCDKCPGDKVVMDNQCVCPSGTQPSDGDKCVTTNVTPQCNANADHVRVDPTTGQCSCVDGFQASGDAQSPCVCPTETHEVKDGLCVKKTTPAPAPTPIANTPVAAPQKITLSAKNLFQTGKSTLTPTAQSELAYFAGQFATATQGSNDPYCIVIVGHTDSTGTLAINQKLSNDRAAAVGNALTNGYKIPAANIRTSGVANTECPEQRKVSRDDCRKVTVEFQNSACN